MQTTVLSSSKVVESTFVWQISICILKCPAGQNRFQGLVWKELNLSRMSILNILREVKNG
jgi:hypothetical protein